MAEKLIIFSRFPEAGATKTRLIPVLSPEGAAGLQRALTERTLALARRLTAIRPVEPVGSVGPHPGGSGPPETELPPFAGTGRCRSHH